MKVEKDLREADGVQDERRNGKIIFNNIEYVKLFPVFNASTAVFVFYPHLIHMYST